MFRRFQQSEISRSRVQRLLQTAFTRAEIKAARGAYQEHLQRFPDEIHQDLADLAHGFRHTELYLEEREAESLRLGLSVPEHEEREALLGQITKDIEEIEEWSATGTYVTAIERLQRWLHKHPGDQHALTMIASLSNRS
jgi:hypothetical protein